MMIKWFVQGFLTSLICLAVGCGDSGDAGSSAAAWPTTVQARESSASTGLDAAKIAELNRQLAIKMTFGAAGEVIGLLASGATTEAKNRYGLPVLFMAAERGDILILEKLIEAGADVNHRIGMTYNDDGAGYSGTADGTPLGYAAAKGKVGAMEVLKKAGANVNGTGLDGTSPLVRAAEAGQVQAVRWLLNNGSTEGKSRALSVAQTFLNPSEDHQQIIALLQQ